MKRLYAVLFFVIAPTLLAQTASESAGAARLVGLQLNDPSLRSLFRSELPQVSFVIGKDEKSGKVQIGNTRGANSWTLALAGPLDENSDRTNFFGDDGLGDTINLEFGLRRAFVVAGVLPSTAREMSEVCLKVIGKRSCSMKEVRDSARFNNDEVILSAAERAAVAAGPNAAKWMLSTSAKTSRKKYAFANGATLEKENEEKTGYALGAGAIYIVNTSRIAPSLLYAVGLTLKRSSSYKDADAVQICEPADVAGAETCRDTPLGFPSNAKKWVAQLETRQFIGGSVALAPRLTFTATDNKDDVWSAELPIYLRNEIDSPFQGGVSLRWDDQNQDFSIAFFVGALAALK